jgi:membrane-associated phospholipid phosphatase
MVAAGAVATLRMVGDMHYASDVIVGAGVGTLVGLGIPFLHYHGLPTLSVTAKSGTATMSVVPSGMGAAVVGSF